MVSFSSVSLPKKDFASRAWSNFIRHQRWYVLGTYETGPGRLPPRQPHKRGAGSPTLSHYGQTRKQRGLSFPRCTSPCSITPRDYTNESIDHARPRSINSSQFTKINWLSEWMNEVGETKKFKYSANGKCRSRKEMIKFFRIFARCSRNGNGKILEILEIEYACITSSRTNARFRSRCACWRRVSQSVTS